MATVFLLSPARTDGVRAQMLLKATAPFDLAVRFRQEGIALADAFSFASGLYFRGKIAYARRFARAEDSIRVITTNGGLWEPDRIVRPADLRKFAEVGIDPADERYLRPLRKHARALRARIGPEGQVVLLGSIATGKYREILLEVFGERLLFPADFVGRGDMSRGALMLHAAQAGRPLNYLKVSGAVLKGRRAGGFRLVALGAG